MLINFIATQLSDVITITQAGASGVILMSSLFEEGLTPSIGLIVRAVNSVNIDINVMVRPRLGISCYNQYDLDVIEDDICAIAETQASCVVIGLLDDNGCVNYKQLEMLLPKLKNKGLIFSRAIDETHNIVESARIISQYEEVKGILTSGGKGDFPARMSTIRKMKEAAPELFISVGGGVAAHNLADIHMLTGTGAYHVGSGIRTNYSAGMGVDFVLAREFLALAGRL